MNVIIDKKTNSYDMFLEVLETNSIEFLANDLFIHKGTIRRWLEKKSVPDNYLNDFNRLLGYKYEIQDTYRVRDQFYTSDEIAEYCIQSTIKVLKKLGIEENHYSYIEPSAGRCSFYKNLPEGRRIGIDIDPKGKLSKELIRSHYLDYRPPMPKKYIVIGNPPFGLRGNLALRFINHSYDFADIVAFILPPLFDSTGKGVPMTRVKGYALAHSEKLPLNSFVYPDGTNVSIATIFQVWTKIHTERIQKKDIKSCTRIAKIYSLSDGGTPSSTRNKNMIDKCDVYLPSTCFSGMKAYTSFLQLPNKRGYGVVFLKHKAILTRIFLQDIDWDKVSFLSTNSAKNLRSDLIAQEIIKQGYYD